MAHAHGWQPAAAALLALFSATLPLRAAPPPAAPPGASVAAAQAHLAWLLANDARETLRDVTIAPADAAKQATALLQFAANLDPSSRQIEKFLAQSAAAAGQSEPQKDALRKLIAADSGDLVSQVQYIDLLAAGSQALDDRAKIYQNALDQSAFDPQIRSEMAVRLARITENRGDAAAARDLLNRALQLNDLNIPALRELVSLAAAGNSPSDELAHMQALCKLLAANPLQAGAWADAARLCEAVGLSDRASDFLKTATEQYQLGGILSGDLFLELSTEEAMAGRLLAADQTAGDLAKIPDAPLSTLLIAYLVSRETTAARQSAGAAATQDAAGALSAEIQKQLAAMVEAAKGDPRASALADASGIALSVLAENPNQADAQADSWIEEYAKLVAADDPTLARLRGWQLFRQGKLTDAAALLEKIASTDPLAKLGLARVYLDRHIKDRAQSALNDLWASHPTGLLGLQVARTARMAGLTLPESTFSQQLRAATAPLTPALASMHLDVTDTLLLTLNFRSSIINYGEPVLLTARITNTTQRPLPVGPDGVIKTSLGIAVTGPDALARIGLYAVDDLQRTYRLPPGQIIEETLRVDRGQLADLLGANPDHTLTVNELAVIAPRIISAGQYSAGVGGVAVAAGGFQTGEIPVRPAAEFQKFVSGASSTQTGVRQLEMIDAAGALLAPIAAGDPVAAGGGGGGGIDPAPLARELAQGSASADALIRAEFLHAIPAGISLGVAWQRPLTAADKLGVDHDPLVRLLFARWQWKQARENDAAISQSGQAALQAHVKTETDERIKAWLTAALPSAKPLPPASTQPAATQN